MGSGAPVYAARPRKAEAVTTSGTAASTTATAASGDYARIVAVDAALYVTGNGTASATNGYYVPSGTVIDIGPMAEGGTISGIEA
jgi:hypothetical protein